MKKTYSGYFILFAATLVILAGRANAEDYEFNGRQRERSVVFSGIECRITSNGQTDISGAYDEPEGVLVIDTNGSSSLKITGSCRQLIVTSMNGLSVVDCSGLRIGRDGVLIKAMSGASVLNLSTDQAIRVNSMVGSSELHYERTAVAPKIVVNKITGAAKVIEGLGNLRMRIAQNRGRYRFTGPDRRAERHLIHNDSRKAYWLISPDVLVAPRVAQSTVNTAPKSPAVSQDPPSGLLVVLEDSSPDDLDRREFWKAAAVQAFGSRYRIALVVPPKWASTQALWVTQGNRAQAPGADFTTESFVGEIVRDIAAQVPINPARIYLHGEGTAGMAAYACSLDKTTPFRGTYILASRFYAAQLPLAQARGRRYIIQHSKQDHTSPFVLAAAGGELLRKQGATVKFSAVTGEHGYQFEGDSWEPLQTALAWLELQK